MNPYAELRGQGGLGRKARTGTRGHRWPAILVCLILPVLAVAAGDWKPVAGIMQTRFAAVVSPTNAHPEYPRPQLRRPDWQSLNGLWEYAVRTAGEPAPTNFDGQILVPFPVESALSGVGKRVWETNLLWYRRTFTVPAGWAGRALLLHFGAVDWQAEVFVNGKKAARHRGGYDSFTVDITPYLRRAGEQELVVAAEDPTEGQQPRGKQSRNPQGIFYTPSSGIWQTVWLEPVPAGRIEGLEMIPDLANRTLHIRVMANRMGVLFRVEAVAYEEGRAVARVVGPSNTELDLQFETPHAWSPGDPFLYDLRVKLLLDQKPVDEVQSYCGLREMVVRKDSLGTPRLFLNGKPFFQVGVLDQGFWPDGLYTAPSEEAWKYELGLLKRMGFTTVRKHVKIEPDAWYYWCDRLGLLVWQDMPSANNLTPAARQQFEIELERMIENLRDHPSIVLWVLFNEGWGQYETERLVSWVKKLDASRLVTGASGWIDQRVGDLVDTHSYPGPEVPAGEVKRAAVLGEFGGLGLVLENHVWPGKSWAYEMLGSSKELAQRYAGLLKRAWMLRDTTALSAVIYTQLSDVESECNGLVTYDRSVVKLDPDLVRAANLGELREPPMRLLSPPGSYDRVIWRYTTDWPGPRWNRRRFNMESWPRGRAGFGTGEGARTAWETPDIWLRRLFVVSAADQGVPMLEVWHNGDAEVYLNGVRAALLRGTTQGYVSVPLEPEAMTVVREGVNLLAVHARATGPDPFIDVGLVVPAPKAAAVTP